MLAGHLATCAGISAGEGGRRRDGESETERESRREREITSHPAPSLLNYSNLTHMGRPPCQRARRAAAVRGSGGDPCPGRSLILPLAEAPRDRFDVWLPPERSPEALLRWLAQMEEDHTAQPGRTKSATARASGTGAATCDAAPSSILGENDRKVFLPHSGSSGP